MTLKNFHFANKVVPRNVLQNRRASSINFRMDLAYAAKPGATLNFLRFRSFRVLFFFILFPFPSRFHLSFFSEGGGLGHLPRCQIGVLAGLLSTSHFRLTDIPSTIGIPKPGKRVIANDGVSETGIKQLVSVPMSMRVGACMCKVSRKHQKETRRISIEYFRVLRARLN